MVESNGTGFRIHSYTAPAVPALLWIEGKRGFPFPGLGMRRSAWHTSTQILHPLHNIDCWPSFRAMEEVIHLYFRFPVD